MEPIVLTFAVDLPTGRLGDRFAVLQVRDVDALRHELACKNVAVLVLGSGIEARKLAALLSSLASESTKISASIIVLGVGNQGFLFQDFIDNDQVFYLAHGLLADADLESVIRAAAEHFLNKVKNTGTTLSQNNPVIDRVLAFSGRVSMQVDVAELASLLVEEARHLLRIEHVGCFVYDAQNDALRLAHKLSSPAQDIASPAAGIVGFVARTHERVIADQIARDPRYDPEIDDSGGSPNAHFIAEPILIGRHLLVGVLVASRESESFTFDDVQVFEHLAACAAPMLKALMSRSQAQAVLNRELGPSIPAAGLFRPEAIAYSFQQSEEDGDLLKSTPRWLGIAHWVLIGSVILCLAYLCIARVDENATGTSVIRARNKTAVVSSCGGIVRSVRVSVGDRIHQSDPLIQLSDAAPSGSSICRDYEVRAPFNGVVSTITVRVNQHLSVDEPVATILGEPLEFEVVTFFPGFYRPRLHAGMSIVITLSGYPDSREDLSVDRIAEEILSPSNVHGYTGIDSSEPLTLNRPTVVVWSILNREGFRADGQFYNYYDGLTGDAEVNLRSQPMVLALFPRLKGLLKDLK
jgi:hypothetical protein